MDKKSDGFTLVEIIIVISILGVIATIAIPRLTGFTNMAKESVCKANIKTVERMYSAFLVENSVDHTDSIFNQFLIENFKEVCPSSGTSSYKNGKVECSVHKHGNESNGNEPPVDEVPWL